MADNFTQDNFQGVFGKFQFVIDETLPLTDDNIQGVFGKFTSVADEAASAGVGGRIMGSLAYNGGLAGPGGIAGTSGGIAG